MDPSMKRPMRFDYTPLQKFLEEKGYDVWLQQNSFNIILFFGFVAFAILRFRSNWKAAKAAGADRQYLEAPDFPEIENLTSFDWQAEEPLKLRPFKPNFFVTMGLEKLPPSELLLFDNTYKKRTSYRKRIIQQHGRTALAVNDSDKISGAIRELYTFLLGTYLPKRYPSMFKLHHTVFESGSRIMFENLVTHEIFPATADVKSDPEILLRTLGRTIDEDFLFLLPETKSKDDGVEPRYVLEAYVVVGPSGWDPEQKLGKVLSAIHAPVPGYKEKLESSMDRYFTSLGVGKYVKRANWSISTHEEMFLPNPSDNKGKHGDDFEVMESIDPDKTWLRCERQTLHRLPRSKAIVFAFKTYLTPLSQIKDEGLGEDFAQAVEGLKNSNVPAMHAHKRGPSWGPAVQKYMRS